MRARSRWSANVAAVAAVAGGLASVPSSAAAVITGVCPDGSMFIVQDSAAIPCAEAKQVEPDRMPPLRPEYLPRPFGWQQHQRRKDPNNPYNLVEDVRRAGEAWRARGATAGGAAATRPPEPPHVSSGPPSARPTPAPPPRMARPVEPAEALALNPDEIRDLFLIVELSQDRAPASFVRARDGGGGESLYVALAHSQSFELRFRQAGLAASDRAGPVLLFSALAREPGTFHGNLFFSQGHLAFHPDHDDSAQFGLLEGRLGDLGAQSVVLGYVVLPPPFDLSQPLDVYWNDRRVEAVLRP